MHYAGASGDLPTDAGTVPTDHQCLDLIDLSPVVTRTVPTSGFAATGDNTLDVVSANHKWTVGNSSLVVDWGSPVAQHVLAGETNWTGIAGDNLWQVDDSSEVSLHASDLVASELCSSEVMVMRERERLTRMETVVLLADRERSHQRQLLASPHPLTCKTTSQLKSAPPPPLVIAFYKC